VFLIAPVMYRQANLWTLWRVFFYSLLHDGKWN
jgi:hypothetical protein